MLNKVRNLVDFFVRPSGEQESDATPDRQWPLRIGWYLLGKDINLASTRYRCFHFARVFHQRGIQSLYFTDAESLCAKAKSLDVIIIVKRLDPSVIKVVAQSKTSPRTAIYLDLCDDTLDFRYSKNTGGINRLVFGAIAPALDGVVVTSAAMAERVLVYCHESGAAKAPVHVIPDIAESEANFRATAAFVEGAPASDLSAVSAASNSEKKSRNVLWFGNFGAPHSNFGIASLLPALPALRAVHKDIPFELVVVSSNQDLFDAIIASSGIPARYVPWSPERSYAELRRADVALLTSGDDEFSQVKSSNRILQALVMGVPVVASGNPALADLADSIVTDDYERGLRTYLGSGREQAVAAALAAAQRVLHLYEPERLGDLWLDLLNRRGEERKQQPRKQQSQGYILIVLDSLSENQGLPDFLSFCKNRTKFRVVTTVAACRNRPALRELLSVQGIIPVVLTSDKAPATMLHGSNGLVLEDNGAEVAARLSAAAKRQGITVTSIAEYLRQPGP